MSRLEHETNPDGTTLAWQYQSCSGNPACPALAMKQVIVTQADTSGSYIRDSQRLADAMGRSVESLSRTVLSIAHSDRYVRAFFHAACQRGV
jgi:hypothetical protein